MSKYHEQFEGLPLPDELSPDEFENLIKDLLKLGQTYQANVDSNDFYSSEEPQNIHDKFISSPPVDKLNTQEILNFVDSLIKDFQSTGSKHFLGYIPSNPNKESIALASLTPFFNQFIGDVKGSPGGVAVECLVIDWICKLLDYPSDSFGCFTSGGSMANLTGIYTGLVHQLKVKGIDIKQDGLIGNKRPIVYFSDQTHFSSEKAITILGLGRMSMRKLRSNDRYELTAEIVEQQIKKDLMDENLVPVMILATCGTTNTGSIDDLTGLYELCKKYELWFHVDGAYGALSALAKLDIAKKTSAINLADSIAVDCHKWFYTPFEAGITLIKNHNILRMAFDITSEYIRDSELEHDIPLQRNFRQHSVQVTRELRGLKVWGTFASFGVEGIKNAITRDIVKADYLRSLILKDSQFDLLPGGELSIVCFRYKGEDGDNQFIIDYVKHRGKFFFSSTEADGRVTLRVCFLNTRSDLGTVDELFELINEAIVGLKS